MRIAKVDGLEPRCCKDVKGIEAHEIGQKVSRLLGNRPLATKRFGSHFICLHDGPKVRFLSLSEFASLQLNCLITEMVEYIPMPRARLLEICRNLYAWQCA